MLIMACIIPVQLAAQNTNNICKEDIIKFSEQNYGLDDYLYQGRKYIYRNVKANGHPYFNTTEWKSATIYCNGRSYQGLTIQYDIENDMFILQVINRLGKTEYIYAENSLIDSLQFDNHLFINLQKVSNSIQANGFYEFVFSGKFMYIVKHGKQFINNYNAINPYGTYSKQLSVLYIIRGNELTACPGMKDFLSCFESNKKEIRRFARQHHIHYKKADKDDLIALCGYADEISSIKE
jgi:hypothetical protein